MSLTLRHEAPADHRAVETLVREAFWNVYKPGCDEHYYLHLLRQSPAFRPELTFVCEVDGVLAGQIACASSSIRRRSRNRFWYLMDAYRRTRRRQRKSPAPPTAPASGMFCRAFPYSMLSASRRAVALI